MKRGPILKDYNPLLKCLLYYGETLENSAQRNKDFGQLREKCNRQLRLILRFYPPLLSSYCIPLYSTLYP